MKILKSSIIMWSAAGTILDLHAMAPAVRKSPALARSGVTVARAATATAATPALRASASRGLATRNVSTRSSTLKNTNILPKESTPKKRWLKSAGLATVAGAISSAVIWQALELADISSKLFDPALFDENLISPEFSRAIVRIINIKDHETVARGSGFIVSTDQNIFLVTAAHCVLEQAEQCIVIDTVTIKLEPVIVDRKNDVAVLNISSEQIDHYYQVAGKIIPYIPFEQISDVKPQPKEVLALQGYPTSLAPSEKPAYRQKFINLGSQRLSARQDAVLDVPGEALVSFNPQDLHGASGSPIIGTDNRRAQIFGLASMASPKSLTVFGREIDLPMGFLHVAGTGQLPEYLKAAQKIHDEKTRQESWSDYFKRTLWGITNDKN